MGTSRVAFIVICMEPGAMTHDPQAIVVGTVEPEAEMPHAGQLNEPTGGTDWRYACYRLSELRAMQSAGPLDIDLEKPHEESISAIRDLLSETSKEKYGMLSDLERQGLDSDIFPSAFLKSKLTGTSGLPAGITMQQTVLVARHVERVFFFSRDSGGAPDRPLASFDTARVVDPDATPMAMPMPHPFSLLPSSQKGLVGSRLVLFPDLSDDTRPNAIAAVALHLQLKVAVNVHWVADEQRRAQDRHDTRMLFELSAKAFDVQGGPRKGMWLAPSKGWRGMRFDRMQLGCTLGPFGKPAAGRSEVLQIDASDIVSFADDRKVLVVEDEEPPDATLYMPLLAAHKILVRKDPEVSITRTFGLRALETDRESITRIGWRFETDLRPGYTVESFLKHPSLQRIYPLASEIAERMQFESLQFAQEQRQDDIALHLAPQRSARTIVTIRFGLGRKPSTLDMAITRRILAHLDNRVGRIHAGLKAVKDGSPISLLPRLHTIARAVPWHLVGTVFDRTPGVRTLTDRNGAPASPLPLIRFTALTPCARFDMWNWPKTPAPNLTGSARATLPLLVTESRRFLCFEIELGVPTASDVSATEPTPCAGWPAYQNAMAASELDDTIDELTPGTRISVTPVRLLGTVARGTDLASAPVPGTEPVRIQAMSFRFASRTTVNTGVELNDHILFWPASRKQGNEGPPLADELDLSIEALLRLPIEQIAAAAEDDLPSAVRATWHPVTRSAGHLPDPDAPLLLPVDGGTGLPSPPVNLSLAALEQVGPDRSHTLALSLRASEERTADAGTVPTAPGELRARRRVLIIEPSPFRIAAVEYDPIDGLGTTENNEVAVWNQSGEGGESWRVRDDRQIVDLIYQPQVLGESMEKNRADLPGAVPDIQPGKPAATRFGSMTILKVDPTYNDTAFREVGWNLRRIMGYPTQRSPGARVLDLRLELLYGLLTRVRSDRLWITELSGAIGAPPAPLPDKSANRPLQRHLARMRAVLAAERRRLAVDKLWRDQPAEDLHLFDGVAHRLRHHLPGEAGGPATPLRWPVSAAIPDDTGGLIDPEVLKAAFSTSQDDRESFPGGVSWAFESANILMRVYGRPDADSGSLRGAHLTALGGFGSQRALFDERKTIVESDTTLGRVQRYRLERIGRIACLWHRAKHVIVYERTVVPSAQFFNQPPIGLRQDEHLGRAILRKVEEYVEILTPVRRYPEDGTSLHETAFFVGAEFKSIKIRVDSAWGCDVRREGWKVPLWNRRFIGTKANSANPDDPAFIYPKPQVCLLIADKNGKPVPHEVADPEKLHFYTSVVQNDTDDTDAWKSVRDVDFSDMPLPELARARTDSADLTDALLPPASATVPGYERFTLTLVPSRELVALTHGRVAGGPLTSLRNVTVARAAPNPGATTGPVQQFGREVAAKAANVRAELDRRTGRILAELDKAEGSGEALRQHAASLIREASGHLSADALGKAIGTTGHLDMLLPKLNPVCDGIKAKVRAQVAGQLNRIVIIASDMVKSSAVELDNGIGQLAGVASAELNRLDSMLALAQESIIALQKADSKETRERAIATAKTVSRRIQEMTDQLVQQAAQAITKQVAELDERIGSITAMPRHEVRMWRARTRADLGTVTQLVSGGLANAGTTVAQPARQAANAASAFGQYLGAAGDVVTNAIKAEAAVFAKRLASYRAMWRHEMANIDGASVPVEARRLLQAVDKAVASMLSAARAIETGAVLAALPPLRTAIDRAATDLETLAASVEQRFAAGTDAIESLRQDMERLLDDALAAVQGPAGVLASVEAQAADWRLALAGAKDAALAALATLDDVNAAVVDVLARLATALPEQVFPPELHAAATLVSTRLAASRDGLRTAITGLNGLITGARNRLQDQTSTVLAGLETGARALERELEKPLVAVLDVLSRTCAQIDGLANQLIDAATGAVNGELLNQWIGDSLDMAGYEAAFQETVNQAIAQGNAAIHEIKAAAAAAAARFTEEAETRARQLAGSLQESLRDITGGADLEDLVRRADGIYQQGDSTLRALSALGNPPRTSNGIDYNRADVRFVMAAANKIGIDMTPSLALVNRAADQMAAIDNAGRAVGELLGSFGVRMPCSNIAESLIPDSLKDLSVANFFPDIAGIDMKGLLKDVGFPDLDDKKAVKFQHRVDEASLRVHMDAEIDVPFAKPVPLMRFGPVEIVIDTARFTAASHMEAGPDGTRNAMHGKIFGDWRIVSAGQTILTFRQTGLYFDDSGKIDFRIQPERIELAEALKFITDLMAATGQKGGLRIEPFVRGGVPSGVAATLDMVLPPIQTGAFGISDLSLHVMFGLAALPTFEIVSEMAIGMRTAPFTLNVWILNGGGYLMQRLSYQPTAKPRALMTYTLEIGIVVGLGIGFSFGVVSGGVWVQVGCSLAFTWANEGTTTTMRVFLLIRGNVDVCGLITASITLLFEVSYDGARMIGAGTLTVRAKISMFYTLEVDQHVEYVFAGEKQEKTEDYAAAYC